MARDIDRFWTTSGRIDTFAFELVSPNDFNKSLGWLSGVTGGKLTFGFDTDLKVSGSLDISTTKFVDDCIIRIHYRPQLSEKQKKDIILGTCFAYVESMSFDKGRYFGSIELVSALARYTDDKLQTNFTIGKNKTYKNELARLLKKESAGGKYKFLSNVTNKKCTSAVAYEAGKPTMDVIQGIADGLDARVDVDEYGVMTFEKYFAPSKKSCTWILPKGKYSVTLPNIEIENARSEVPNRIAYHCEVSWSQKEYVLDKKGKKTKYTSGENKGKYKTKTVNEKKTIVGKAQVKSNSPYHYSKMGRWKTEVFEYTKKLSASKMDTAAKRESQFAKVKKEADSKAATKLSSLTSSKKKYIIDCFYMPIKCGQVVEFEYVASGISLHVQAMVTNIEMNLSVGARMKVTLKHVRYV